MIKSKSRKGSNIDDLCYLLLNTNISTAERLLANKQPPDICKADGRTPLMTCALTGDEDRFDLFYHHGANINKQDKQERNCLHLAVLNKQTVMVRKLCNLPVERNAIDSDGQTPLMISLSVGLPELTRLLITKGCDVNAGSVCISELKALHLAVIRPECHLIIPALLQAGGEVDCIDSVGRTPLIYSVKGKFLSVTETLLQNGANPNKYNPLQFSLDLELTEVSNLLLSYGADPGQQPIQGLSVNPFCQQFTLFENELSNEQTEVFIEKVIAEDGYLTSSGETNYILHKFLSSVHEHTGKSRTLYKMIAYGLNIGGLLGKCFCQYSGCRNDVKGSINSVSVSVPLPLAVLSRNAVRYSLGKGVSQKAKHLPVPKSLQEYLFSKIWDDKLW